MPRSFFVRIYLFALYFFSTAFDILAEALDSVAGGEADAHGDYTKHRDQFFHDFSFRIVSTQMCDLIMRPADKACNICVLLAM